MRFKPFGVVKQLNLRINRKNLLSFTWKSITVEKRRRITITRRSRHVAQDVLGQVSIKQSIIECLFTCEVDYIRLDLIVCNLRDLLVQATASGPGMNYTINN